MLFNALCHGNNMMHRVINVKSVFILFLRKATNSTQKITLNAY